MPPLVAALLLAAIAAAVVTELGFDDLEINQSMPADRFELELPAE